MHVAMVGSAVPFTVLGSSLSEGRPRYSYLLVQARSLCMSLNNAANHPYVI